MFCEVGLCFGIEISSCQAYAQLTTTHEHEQSCLCTQLKQCRSCITHCRVLHSSIHISTKLHTSLQSHGRISMSP